MLLTLLLPLAAAQVSLGADWVPSPRADLVWVNEAQSTGTLVGEFDGLLRPPLQPYLGLNLGRNTLNFGLSAARVSTTAFNVAEYERAAAGAVRPSVDYLRWLLSPGVAQAGLWVGGGAWANVPLASFYQSGANESESGDNAEYARSVRSRIGGFGARVSLGAQTELNPSLALGLRASLVGFRGQQLSEDALRSTTLVYPEVGLRVQINLPPRSARPGDTPDTPPASPPAP